jgi:DNA-binding MarR family transcriptional regulator
MHQRDELMELLGGIALRARAERVDPSVQTDLTQCELCVLTKLVFKGPLPVREVLTDLSVSPSAMTAAVNRLTDKGLVRREVNAHDRRRLVLHATDSAAFALQQSSVDFAGVAAAMLESLSEGERDELLRLLRRAAPTLSRACGSDPGARKG